MKNKIQKKHVALAAATVVFAVIATLTNEPGGPPPSPLLAPADELTEHVYIPHLYTPMYAPQAHNLGFEGGRWFSACQYLYPSETPDCTIQRGEIQPGEGWTAWWIENYPSGAGWYTKPPEVKIIALDEGFPAPLRIAEGQRALQWFTFWKTGWGGVFQTVELPSGWWRVGARPHAWYSNCDTDPHGTRVLDYDCETELDTDLWFRVGADPTGSINRYSGNIAWGPSAVRYGTYGPERLVSQWFYVPSTNSSNVTIWLECRSELPLKHADCYWDDVIIEQPPVWWRAVLRWWSEQP